MIRSSIAAVPAQAGVLMLGIAGLMLASSASAAAYRWTDAKGQVHFTQTPPSDRPYTAVPASGSAVGVLSTPTPTPSATPGQPSDTQRFLQNAAAAEAQKRQQKADEQKKRNELAAACAQARERLQFLDSHPPNRLMQREEGGEPRRVTSEQWDKERSDAGKIMQDNCR